MSQSTVDAILAVLLTAVLTTMWVMVSRQRTTRTAWQTALRDQGDQFAASLNQQASQFRESLEGLSRTFADQMQRVTVSLTELNTGASAGARAAITDLREELRSSFREVGKDVSQLRSEHDNLVERHANTNATVVQLAERVNGTRELVHELRRERPERRAE